MKPNHGGEYYYLESSHADYRGNGLQLTTFLNDVQNGVKRLAEYSYVPYYGTTQGSLRFMNLLRNHIDVRGKSAQLKYTQKKGFSLTVETFSGYELFFKGIGGGYFGEGSRGTYDILKACGFSEEQCSNAFKKEEFRVYKRALKKA